jgi:small conductance mechanosensitive channel
MLNKSLLYQLGLFLSSLILLLQIPSQAQGELPIPVLNQTPQLSSQSYRVVESRRIGNLVYAPILLDGREVFQIASPVSSNSSNSDLSIDFRVNQVENQLKALVRRGDPESLQLSIATYNNQTVIVARDKRHYNNRPLILGTVTDFDAQFHGTSIENLAQQALVNLNSVIKKAWEERRPEAIRKRISLTLVILLVMGILTTLLWRWQKHLYYKLKTLEAEKPDVTEHSPPLQRKSEAQQQLEMLKIYQAAEVWKRKRDRIILPWRLVFLFNLFLWFSGLIFGLRLFPETRFVGIWLQGKPTNFFLVWIGMYLIIKIGNLIIDYLGKAWTLESALYHNDSARNYLKISTYLVVLKSILPVVSVLVGLVVSLLIIGIPLSTLLTGLGLISFAVSLAAQNLIKSLINGLMILGSDLYAVGDLVSINNQAEGLVENFNLFYSQLRGPDGDLITLPNGEVIIVFNKTKDWSRVNFTIQVEYGTDINLALAVIERTAKELYYDPDWFELFMEIPEVLGVDALVTS